MKIKIPAKFPLLWLFWGLFPIPYNLRLAKIQLTRKTEFSWKHVYIPHKNIERPHGEIFLASLSQKFILRFRTDRISKDFHRRRPTNNGKGKISQNLTSRPTFMGSCQKPVVNFCGHCLHKEDFSVWIFLPWKQDMVLLWAFRCHTFL